MILGIRTDSMDATLVLAAETKVIETRTWPAGRKLSMELLPAVEDLLARHKVEPPQLTGLVIYEGPGSFTGLRIGATVANAMAYALGIPIAGSTGDDWLKEGVGKLKTEKPGRYVMPQYGAEANITKPKK